MELAILFFLFEMREILVNRNTFFREFVMYYVNLWIKSPIIFFLSNINFIYLNFCIFWLNIHSFIIMSLYVLYFCDVVFKIVLAYKIQNNTLSDEFREILQSDLRVEIWQRVALSLGITLVFFVGVS